MFFFHHYFIMDFLLLHIARLRFWIIIFGFCIVGLVFFILFINIMDLRYLKFSNEFIYIITNFLKNVSLILYFDKLRLDFIVSMHIQKNKNLRNLIL